MKLLMVERNLRPVEKTIRLIHDSGSEDFHGHNGHEHEDSDEHDHEHEDGDEHDKNNES